jgi:hypothetical protein
MKTKWIPEPNDLVIVPGSNLIWTVIKVNLGGKCTLKSGKRTLKEIDLNEVSLA